jgi:peptide/nickel transport system permease protein
MQPNITRHVLLALVMLTGVCLMLPWLPTQDPLAVMLAERFALPGMAHWFGTDELGRDLFSRVVHGAALTVSISIAALLSSLAIGVMLGALAGYYYNRWPDRLFSWVADFLVSVPFLIVIAAVLSLTGPGLGKAYLVLTAIIWVSPARIVRAEVIKTLPLDYVLAERAIGNPEWRILFITVMPACVDAAILFSVGYLPEIIALEAGLSFLGLGVQPPQPSLGKMIFDGITYLGAAWWVAIIPAAALFLIVTGVQAVAWYARYSQNLKRIA